MPSLRGNVHTLRGSTNVLGMHVGRVLPSGYGWQEGMVELRQVKQGTLGAADPMSTELIEEVVGACGSVSEAARRAGLDRSYIQRARKGRCSLSQKVADRLREVLTG